jgi:small conductance mechanosensitive channel
MDLTMTPTHLDRLADVAWTWAAAFLPRLVAAVVILVIGTILARWVSRAVDKVSRRTTHIDPTLRPVLASMIRYAVLILVLIVALSQVGIQTASLLAVVGAAGLAIGLALQGTLSNFAAGLMLLWLRPFGLAISSKSVPSQEQCVKWACSPAISKPSMACSCSRPIRRSGTTR